MSLHKYHPKSPVLILVMGVAGSGKSTLAAEILRRVCAVYLDNNHIADAFFPNTRRGRRYERVRPALYKALYTIAAENLARGSSVLLDVPHIKEVQIAKWRDFITKLARKNNASLIVLRCSCSGETLRMRLTSRKEARDKWKLNHWQEFLAEQPVRASIPFPHMSINTENSLTMNTKHAVQYIKHRTRPMEGKHER